MYLLCSDLVLCGVLLCVSLLSVDGCQHHCRSTFFSFVLSFFLFFTYIFIFGGRMTESVSGVGRVRRRCLRYFIRMRDSYPVVANVVGVYMEEVLCGCCSLPLSFCYFLTPRAFTSWARRGTVLRFRWCGSVFSDRVGGRCVVRWSHLVLVRRTRHHVVVRLSTLIDGELVGGWGRVVRCWVGAR